MSQSVAHGCWQPSHQPALLHFQTMMRNLWRKQLYWFPPFFCEQCVCCHVSCRSQTRGLPRHQMDDARRSREHCQTIMLSLPREKNCAKSWQFYVKPTIVHFSMHCGSSCSPNNLAFPCLVENHDGLPGWALCNYVSSHHHVLISYDNQTNSKRIKVICGESFFESWS